MADELTHGSTSPRSRPAARPTKSGDLGCRLLRHHLPLAAASALALVLFMTLSVFSRSTGHEPGAAIGSPMPEMATPAPGEHGGGQGGSGSHDGEQSGAGGHGSSPAPSMDQSGGQSGSGGRGSSPAPSMDHSGGRGGSADGDATMQMGDDRAFVRQFTVATGYVATGLLAATLLIGPINLALRRRNPVSSYLRRDAGIWTAMFSVVHVVAGFQVHGALSDFLKYFLASDGAPLMNAFGLGNWTGLAATVLVVGLLALSSDFALRRLTARPWKRLQRLNYALFALVLAHAIFYGALSRTTSPFTLLLGIIVIVVFVGQVVGVWLWRRKDSRPAARLV